jgi:cell division protein FtsL
MPKFFKLTNVHHRISRSRMPKIFISSKATQRILIGLIAVIGVSYVAFLSTLSTRGYRMQEIQNELASVKQENVKMSREIVKLSSPQRIAAEMKNAGLVAVKNVRFVNESGALAQR